MGAGLPPGLAAAMMGGAGGAPGAPGSAPPGAGGAPGAPAGAPPSMGPQASFMGRMMAQQNDPAYLVKTIEQLMVMNGELMGRLMHQDPDAYQDVLDIQKKLGSAKTKLSKKAQASVPIQNAVAQLTRMMPGQKPPAY